MTRLSRLLADFNAETALHRALAADLIATHDAGPVKTCLMCGATRDLWLGEDGWACRDWRPCAQRAQDAKAKARNGGQ